MSNLISNAKRKIKRLNKKDASKLVTTMNNSGGKTLNFSERIIPNSLYINVKSGDFIVTHSNKTIGETEVAFKANSDNSNMDDVLGFLKELDPDSISKVILDNGDGFKIKALTELINDVEREVALRKSVLDAQQSMTLEAVESKAENDGIQNSSPE